MNFKGKTAVVTGGTRGIGKAIVLRLRRYGCNVIATGTKRNLKKSQRINGVRYEKLDFLVPESIASFIAVIQKLKNIDILINNAGINIIESIDSLQKENWDKVLQVNLTGPMNISKEIVPLMKRGGKILNVSSIWGIMAKEKRHSYAAAKTGLIGLTKTMALDLAARGVLVNALCPGFTITELTRESLSKKEIISLARQIPLKRFAHVDEIAEFAVFLCSDLNTYITGQALVIDGGFSI
ncbi:MAG: SDR family oxidoreductase [bacterium]